MQVQVHLIERLLDVLDPHGPAFDQALAMALQGAQPANGVFGAKRCPEQSVTVQLLQPLAILHVALTSRHMLDLSRIDQEDFKTCFFELL